MRVAGIDWRGWFRWAGGSERCGVTPWMVLSPHRDSFSNFSHFRKRHKLEDALWR
jgi:hypothetical protein